MTLYINTAFDGGSIVVKSLADSANLRFNVRNDSNSHFAQWFYFQVSGIARQSINCHLEDLAGTAYPQGWEDYQVCASFDNQNWFRVPTSYQNNCLSWQIPQTDAHNSIYFAYFEPYPYARHLQLIAKACQHPQVEHQVIGQTSDGRNLDLLVIGKPSAPYKIWLTARQHPGETMAEWLIEGLLERLLDSADGVSRQLLTNCVVYVVANMNPDGSVRGNLRTNSHGKNLNREWLNPTKEYSPEVYYVREAMLASGVDLFLDIHGDEALPYLFTAGCQDNLNYSAKQQRLTAAFEQILLQICPDYQTTYGYEKGHFTSETPTLATNWVGAQFDCLALTLEMPFKDTANLPYPPTGWSGHRSALLGKCLITAIHCVLPHFNS